MLVEEYVRFSALAPPHANYMIRTLLPTQEQVR